MVAYKQKYTLVDIVTKENIINGVSDLIIENKIPDEKEISINWNNINRYKNVFSGLWIDYCKKGKILYLYNKPIKKEWKNNLSYTLYIHSYEVNPPIIKVLNYHSGDKAIAYLKERGLFYL